MKNGVQKILIMVSLLLSINALVVFVDGRFSASMDDRSEEWDVSHTIMAAQDAAIAEAEKQRNAQVFCSATAGESVVVWQEDGEFTCKARRKK